MKEQDALSRESLAMEVEDYAYCIAPYFGFEEGTMDQEKAVMHALKFAEEYSRKRQKKTRWVHVQAVMRWFLDHAKLKHV